MNFSVRVFGGVKYECELFFLFLFSTFSVSVDMEYTSSLQNYNDLFLTLCVKKRLIRGVTLCYSSVTSLQLERMNLE